MKIFRDGNFDIDSKTLNGKYSEEVRENKKSKKLKKYKKYTTKTII